MQPSNNSGFISLNNYTTDQYYTMYFTNLHGIGQATEVETLTCNKSWPEHCISTILRVAS